VLGTTLILTGVALIAGAIIGGGVKLLQVEFREIPSLSRQLLLGAFGLILVVAGLIADGRLNLPAPSNDSRTATPAVQSRPDKNQSATSTVRGLIAPAEQPSHALRVEQPSVTSAAADIEPTAVLTPDDLRSALRLELGNPTGSVVGGSEVRHVKLWLELTDAQRRLVRSVRYEFYDPSFRSPKYPDGSSAYAATWSGYGCINDAAVIMQTTAGGVKARFDLCTLWEHGRL
jgi:hypothetical protein